MFKLLHMCICEYIFVFDWVFLKTKSLYMKF